jgi:polyisoprenoid-binding protein YceI
MSVIETATLIPAGTWAVDPSHSSVEFHVKHMGIATVRGKFTQFEGTVDTTTGVAHGKVDVASVDTNEAQRDEHLRSADFFDAENNPELAFRSTAIVAGDDEDELAITGQLTINGVTREITLRATITGTDVDPWGNERVGLEVRGTLNRSDYGMKFNQALGSGNVLVSDKVKLLLDLSAVKQA